MWEGVNKHGKKTGYYKGEIILQFKQHNILANVTRYAPPSHLERFKFLAICRPNEDLDLMDALCSKKIRFEQGRAILNKLYYKRHKVYILVY